LSGRFGQGPFFFEISFKVFTFDFVEGFSLVQVKKKKMVNRGRGYYYLFFAPLHKLIIMVE
jgi:hypothetical protein